MAQENDGAAAPGVDGEAPLVTGEASPPAGAPAAVEGEGGAPEVGGDGPAAGSPPAEGAGAEEKSAPAPDWRDKRIAKLTGRAKELAEKLAAFQGGAAAAPPATAPGGEAPLTAPPAATPVDVDRLVNERIAAQRFNEDCLRVAKAGKDAFPDFDARMKDLGSIADPTSPQEQAAYVTMLATAIKVGNTEHLLYSLAKDPGEAERIMALPPIDQALEMSKLAGGLKTPGNDISGAAKPISPVSGAGGRGAVIAAEDPTRADKLDTKEWMARRNATIKARVSAGRGR